MLHLFALKVLLLAGGGSPDENHESHLQHVQVAAALFAARGVEDVTIFWADGQEKAPDRAAARHKLPQDDWLIQGARLDPLSDPGPILKDTRLPGARPATRAALQAFLKEAGASMKAGDTLLIAVTDHGEPDPEGQTQTAITLWGERWRVADLKADLAPLSPDVRVVLWMSQCFSGGFALHSRPNTCGAFSAVSDRPAYGCIPAWAERADVGHFLRMIEAFEGGATRMAEAADAVLLSDDTPDTPHLSSDAFLYMAIARQAATRGVTVAQLIDAALPLQPADHPDWARLARLVTRYGLGAPRSARQINEILDELSGCAEALAAWHRVWSEALKDALDLLGKGYYPLKKGPVGQAKRLDLRRRLIKRLQRRLSKQPGVRARLERMRAQRHLLDEIYDQLSLQEGAAIRAAYLLARITASALLSPQEQATLDALRRCENAPLLPPRPEPPPAPSNEATPTPQGGPRPLPRFQRLWGRIEASRPGYFGLSFRDLPGFKGVEVLGLLPGGPAMASDLRVGDQILAVDGWRLRRQGGFHEASLLAPPGSTATLLVKRGAQRLEIPLTVAPRPRPLQPLGIGASVGDLWLEGYNGYLPVIGGRPVILFFWATWCAPCKEALPSLRAFAQRHGAALIAVTDEPRARVAAFLADALGFPTSIALDVAGEAKRAFEVERLPAFVLLDAEGVILEMAEGFADALPLRGDGLP
ncbi:redoxin domain-containing protein [Myxococcota bacterium]|nr:redoxin domain-containing protein [Myxococcota bacterium]MBU1430685.1 redoxin domain-containing protein [Myxococcota bacterium]MBU1899483.1 redoxin domain-containing protein [Myxococcota bacterium]